MQSEVKPAKSIKMIVNQINKKFLIWSTKKTATLTWYGNWPGLALWPPTTSGLIPVSVAATAAMQTAKNIKLNPFMLAQLWIDYEPIRAFYSFRLSDVIIMIAKIQFELHILLVRLLSHVNMKYVYHQNHRESIENAWESVENISAIINLWQQACGQCIVLSYQFANWSFINYLLLFSVKSVTEISLLFFDMSRVIKQ